MKYLKIFTDFDEALEMIGDVEAGRLFKAAMKYAKLGEAPELRGNEKFLWVQLKQSIDRSREVYARKADTARENGAKKGRKAHERTDIDQYLTNIGRYCTDIDQYQPDIGQEKDKEKDKDYITTPLPPPGDGGGGASYLADNLRGMTAGNYDELRSFLEDGVTMDLVRYAVDEAAAHGARTWAYVRKVLNNCLAAGALTASQARELQKDEPAEKPSNRFLSEEAMG